MAESVVSFVGQRAGELLLSEAKFLYGVPGQVDELCAELRRMQCFLKDADERQEESELINNLVVEIRDVAYDAEDVLETFTFKVVTRGRRSTGIGNMLIRFCCILKQGIALHEVGSEIEAIKSKISKLITSLQNYSIRPAGVTQGDGSSSSRQERQRQLRYSYSHLVEEDFVGFDKDLNILVDTLVDRRKECQVVAICGMGGLGKTTIARKVYHHRDVRCNFDNFAWVCVSQQWQQKNIVQGILNDLVPREKELIASTTMDDLVKRLYDLQQEKKCLVVLDDVWFMQSWDSLKAAFPSGINSKILITTRNAEVALHVDPKCFLHEPKFLSEEDSWNLLQKKAFARQESRVDKEMEKKGREMVQKCGGLPLAIVVLGGLLANRHTLKEWEMVHQSMDVYLRKGKGIGTQEVTVQDVLALSFNDLPYQLKPCFLYLGNFPEDYNIGAETLCLLWLAESLISLEDQGEGETMVDVAERYIGELAQRSMIQVKFITDDSWWVTTKRFETLKLHDLMRDLCLSRGRSEDFLKVLDFRLSRRSERSSVVGVSRARRLAVFVNKDSAGSVNVQEEATRVRSLVFLNPNGWWQSLRWPAEIPDLNAFTFLRVLSLYGFDFRDKKFPKGLGKLLHLRYLGLRNCYLEELPSSIGKLNFLQTLDLHLFDEVMIPNVLWKIDQFKHLYLPEKFCVEDDEKLSFEGLSKLETLRNFDPVMCNVEDLVKLTNLMNFGARVTGNLEDAQEIINYLNFASQQLQQAFLVVKTSDFCSSTGIYIIQQLFGCQALHFLGLEGRIGKLPAYGSSHFSSSITRINMCMSQLEEDPLTTLEKLPNLRGLILYMDAYLGAEMVCSAMGFPQLRNLRFWYLHSFRRWVIDKGAMPNLSTLEINNCRELEMIPDGMRFLTTLQKLNIYDMPEAFRDRVRVVNGVEGEDFDKVRHVPSITFSIF